MTREAGAWGSTTMATLPPKSAALENFERLLAAGKDGALLRFSLGNEYLKSGDSNAAAEHLARAVALDPNYTAAWKLYGKALAAALRRDEAIAAYRSGIEVATRKGDRQAEKEMGVFLRRLERTPTLAASVADDAAALPPTGE